MNRIALGDEVQCIVTNFKGIATGRCEYLNGCVQYSVRPPVNKDNKRQDAIWIDEEQLKVTELEKVKTISESSGGGNRNHPY